MLIQYMYYKYKRFNIITIMFKYLQKLSSSFQNYLQQVIVKNPVLRRKIPQKERIDFLLGSYLQRLKQQPIVIPNQNSDNQQSYEDETRSTKNQQRFKWGIRIITALVLAKIGHSVYKSWYTEISWKEFTQLLKNEDIRNITVKKHGNDYHAYINAYVRKYHLIVGDISSFNAIVKSNIPITYYEQPEGHMVANNLHRLLSFTSSILLIVVSTTVIWNLIRKGPQSIANIQMKRQTIVPVNPKTRFSDVAGCDDSKLEITEFVEFLKNPQKFKKLGAKIPRGALLFGPPGTGKTLLAKACAGEAGVPFFATSGSQFAELFVGSGPARVRQLFAQAKKKTPSIIFIDEIDSIARSRSSSGDSANDQRANTLNQILVQMDGFGTNTEVIVMAATNRKQLLDSAITRPGRFDRLIQIGLPDIQGRQQVLMVHLKPINLNPEMPIQQYARRLATLTPGFSGADLQNLCNQAAIIAVRNKKKYVSKDDFETATQRVIGGVQKNKLLSQKERKTVAYHECGHAVVAWFLKGADPLLKVSIIPRSKGALGFAQYLPSQTQLYSKQQIYDKISVILGGRCSQLHFFNEITTGAVDDLQKVYKWARMLVTRFGMSDRIGLLSLQESDSMKGYSEQTNQIIDQQVIKVVNQCTERTKAIISEHASKISALAERLIQKQTIDTRVIEQILGARPFQAKRNYRKYLQQIRSTEKQSS